MYQKEGEKMERETLINARLSKKLSQAQVADDLGLAEVTVRKIEKGNRNPSSKTAVKFASYFGRDIKELFPDIFLPNFDTKRIKSNAKEVSV